MFKLSRQPSKDVSSIYLRRLSEMTMSTKHLHGSGTNRPMNKYHLARQRVQVAQKKDEDEAKHSGESHSGSSGSSGVIVVLVVMVTITWGIAATSYFGIVDYKALVTRFSYNHGSDGDLFKITDKRRPIVAPVTPARKHTKLVELDGVAPIDEGPNHEEVKQPLTEKNQENIVTEKQDEVNEKPEAKKQPESSKPETQKPPATEKDKDSTFTLCIQLLIGSNSEEVFKDTNDTSSKYKIKCYSLDELMSVGLDSFKISVSSGVMNRNIQHVNNVTRRSNKTRSRNTCGPGAGNKIVEMYYKGKRGEFTKSVVEGTVPVAKNAHENDIQMSEDTPVDKTCSKCVMTDIPVNSGYESNPESNPVTTTLPRKGKLSRITPESRFTNKKPVPPLPKSKIRLCGKNCVANTNPVDAEVESDENQVNPDAVEPKKSFGAISFLNKGHFDEEDFLEETVPRDYGKINVASHPVNAVEDDTSDDDDVVELPDKHMPLHVVASNPHYKHVHPKSTHQSSGNSIAFNLSRSLTSNPQCERQITHYIHRQKMKPKYFVVNDNTVDKISFIAGRVKISRRITVNTNPINKRMFVQDFISYNFKINLYKFLFQRCVPTNPIPARPITKEQKKRKRARPKGFTGHIIPGKSSSALERERRLKKTVSAMKFKVKNLVKSFMSVLDRKELSFLQRTKLVHDVETFKANREKRLQRELQFKMKSKEKVLFIRSYLKLIRNKSVEVAVKLVTNTTIQEALIKTRDNAMVAYNFCVQKLKKAERKRIINIIKSHISHFYENIDKYRDEAHEWAVSKSYAFYNFITTDADFHTMLAVTVVAVIVYRLICRFLSMFLSIFRR